MVTIHDYDGDGNRVVVYDSSWRHPAAIRFLQREKEKREKMMKPSHLPFISWSPVVTSILPFSS